MAPEVESASPSERSEASYRTCDASERSEASYPNLRCERAQRGEASCPNLRCERAQRASHRSGGGPKAPPSDGVGGSGGQSPPGLKRESRVDVDRPHRQRASRGAEPGVARLQTGRIHLTVDELRVADRQVGRAVELDLVLAVVVDHGVERVERIHAELDAAIAADADIPRQRQVDRVVRAAAHDVAARLETNAVVRRTGHRGDVELRVLVARAALARIAGEDDPRAVLRRAG